MWRFLDECFAIFVWCYKEVAYPAIGYGDILPSQESATFVFLSFFFSCLQLSGSFRSSIFHPLYIFPLKRPVASLFLPGSLRTDKSFCISYYYLLYFYFISLFYFRSLPFYFISIHSFPPRTVLHFFLSYIFPLYTCFYLFSYLLRIRT